MTWERRTVLFGMAATLSFAGALPPPLSWFAWAMTASSAVYLSLGVFNRIWYGADDVEPPV